MLREEMTRKHARTDHASVIVQIIQALIAQDLAHDWHGFPDGRLGRHVERNDVHGAVPSFVLQRLQIARAFGIAARCNDDVRRRR